MVDLEPLNGSLNGEPAGTQAFSGPNEHLFEADLPASVDCTKPMRFEFAVQHSFKPADPRDLGVVMPFTGAIRGTSEKLHFWLY